MVQNDNLAHQTTHQNHALMEDTGSGARGAFTEQRINNIETCIQCHHVNKICYRCLVYKKE